ncbi:hypothetical protein P170DRAFT_278192 [Aspergillus steynii IBT 23096]|uniref:Uncharacterized protein n=1 Tax=Aspergillus steynii IBT 23096 TaxID=1392250 RepID=A0A2I2FXB6_9EURO|nr:uncharacterized protein P170DRAFT_278192 [Aspergillus steynii IBT 23096]PLB45274.1 hypothetical protein P170DRAFT_278192 [Aspergillus steynii IBT 23096]
MVVPGGRPDGGGGCDGGSESELEGGGGFGAGGRGRRTLDVRLVLCPFDEGHRPLATDWARGWRPMGGEGGGMSGGGAYRGGLAQGLTGDSPEGHAARDSTCQHTDNMKGPPIDGKTRRHDSLEKAERGGGGGGGREQERVLSEVKSRIESNGQVSLGLELPKPSR